MNVYNGTNVVCEYVDKCGMKTVIMRDKLTDLVSRGKYISIMIHSGSQRTMSVNKIRNAYGVETSECMPKKGRQEDGR